MAIGLNDKNLEKVKGEIKAKGFTQKFWQDYRSWVSQGSGVGKCMKALSSLGVTPSGDFKNVDPEDLAAVITTFEQLDLAMGKAEMKAKKGKPLTKHTYDFCKEFARVINTRHVAAIKFKTVLEKKMEERQAKAKEDEAKLLKEYNVQRDKKEDIVFKELGDLDKRARGITKACDVINNELPAAVKDIRTLMSGLRSQADGDGAVAPEIADRFEKALLELQKKHNVPVHASNLKTALPKLFKEVTGLFPQYIKVEFAKKATKSLAGSIKEAQIALKRANEAFKLYAERHRELAEAIKLAKTLHASKKSAA